MASPLHPRHCQVHRSSSPGHTPMECCTILTPTHLIPQAYISLALRYLCTMTEHRKIIWFGCVGIAGCWQYAAKMTEAMGTEISNHQQCYYRAAIMMPQQPQACYYSPSALFYGSELTATHLHDATHTPLDVFSTCVCETWKFFLGCMVPILKSAITKLQFSMFLVSFHSPIPQGSNSLTYNLLHTLTGEASYNQQQPNSTTGILSSSYEKDYPALPHASSSSSSTSTTTTHPGPGVLSTDKVIFPNHLLVACVAICSVLHSPVRPVHKWCLCTHVMQAGYALSDITVSWHLTNSIAPTFIC